jgi:Winged helix-turn helix
MRGRKKSFSLRLTAQQRAELQRWQRTSTLPVGLVRRARLILLLDQDQPVGVAAATVGLAPKNARKWIRRFLAQGLAGLKDQQRTGRPPVFSPRGCATSGQDGVRATG